MRILLTKTMAGPGGTANPGDEIDLERSEALRLVAAGAARPVLRSEPVEKTVSGAEEHAVVGPAAEKSAAPRGARRRGPSK